MKPHVAIFVTPSHGHINPTLGVTRELVSRGYRVTYAAPERYGPALTEAGAEVVTYEVSVALEGFASSRDKTRKVVDFWRGLDKSLKTHEVFLKDRPDVILFDSQDVSGALFAKNSRNIPSIRLFPSFAHNHAFSWSHSRGESSNAMAEEDIARTFDNALPNESIGSYLVHEVSANNIVFIPKFFQYHADRFDDRFAFVGPAISERPFYGAWSPPQGARNIVLVSLGTVLNAQVEHFRACMNALKHLDLHVVMSLGAGVDVRGLGEIPSNFEVHAFVSHIDVLPHVCAFIGHGGMNSTMEALYHGVPMLLAPQDALQKLIATRVAELGLGKLVSVTPEATEELAMALRALLVDQPLLDRVKAVSEEMRKSQAAQAAAELVDRVFWKSRHA